MSLIRRSAFLMLSRMATAVSLIPSSCLSRVSTVEISFCRRNSIAACTLLKSETAPLSLPLEVQSARSSPRCSMYRASSCGMVGSLACARASANASSRAAFLSFSSAIQSFRPRTSRRISRRIRFAALMFRFSSPRSVTMPFFSICVADTPTWTVGICSIPCRS